jgi:hypothetical protein
VIRTEEVSNTGGKLREENSKSVKAFAVGRMDF